MITAQHIPGISNVVADSKSRLERDGCYPAVCS